MSVSELHGQQELSYLDDDKKKLPLSTPRPYVFTWLAWCQQRSKRRSVCVVIKPLQRPNFQNAVPSISYQQMSLTIDLL